MNCLSVPRELHSGQTDRKQKHTGIYPAVTGAVTAVKKKKQRNVGGNWGEAAWEQSPSNRLRGQANLDALLTSQVVLDMFLDFCHPQSAPLKTGR